MNKRIGESGPLLNLIQPSPLRVTTILKTAWTYFVMMILLMSAFYGMQPSMGALANSEPAENQESMFAVWPVHPENQIDETRQFFYLETSPGTDQWISIIVENFTGEYQTLEVAIHLATTFDVGRVNYWGSDEPPDTTLPHNIEDLVSFEPFIQLEPYESTEFFLNIQMPAVPYQGVLAGGLVFTSVEEPLQRQLISILMRQDGFVDPNVVLEDVTLEVIGGQSVILATIRNITATFIGQMSITTEVRDAAGELVFTDTRYDMEMAPNSSLAYEVGLNGLRMSAELYEVTFIVESESLREEPWVWPLVWTELEGTGTATIPAETIEEEEAAEPTPEVEEPQEALPEAPAMLDEESIYNVLLLLMVITGIFVFVAIIVSIARKRREKVDDFMELQEQILATLMNDSEEEAKVKPTRREKQAPERAKGEQSKEKAFDERDHTPEGKKKPSQDKIATIDKDAIEKKEREIARKQRELENKEKLLRAKEKTIEEKQKELEKELEKKESEKKERLEKRIRTMERKREEWEIDI